METESTMLDLLTVPAFTVESGTIAYANRAAQDAMLCAGDPVEPLLVTGQQELAAMKSGSLFLTMKLMGKPREASVHAHGADRIFVVEQEDMDSDLQLLTLAASKLREPLNDVMMLTDQMFPGLMESENPELRRQMAQMNRGLFRILRTVGNMSDAGEFLALDRELQMEPTELCSFFAEVAEKAENLTGGAGVEVQYLCPPADLVAMADRAKLERAAYNLLSNALKFTPPGGHIQVELKKRGNLAVFRVTDDGEGIPDDILGTVYARFRREPSPGDTRWGIGLGLPLVRRTAAFHGGSLLLHRTPEGGTAAAMTIRLREVRGDKVSAPVLRVDYTGEHDHGLVEMADCLPWQAFEPGDIN